MKNLILAILVVYSFILIGCGDSDSDSDGFQVDGEWTGTWQANTVNGDVEVTLTQNGTELTGTGSLNGSTCLNNVSIWGVLDEETKEIYLLLLDPEISDEDMRTLDPSASSSSFEGMERVLTATGSFSTEDSLSLTYEVVEWSYCDGTNGVINLDRR